MDRQLCGPTHHVNQDGLASRSKDGVNTVGMQRYLRVVSTERHRQLPAVPDRGLNANLVPGVWNPYTAVVGQACTVALIAMMPALI